MAFGDRYTLDDLQRAHARRESVTLAPMQVDDLLDEVERLDDELRDELQAIIAPVVREMPLKWRKALATALGTNAEDLVA